MAESVTVYEVTVTRTGRVLLQPAVAGCYRDEATESWQSKGVYCDFSTKQESVAGQLQDALNWVGKRNPGCTMQMVAGGGSMPGATFWVIASPAAGFPDPLRYLGDALCQL